MSNGNFHESQFGKNVRFHGVVKSSSETSTSQPQIQVKFPEVDIEIRTFVALDFVEKVVKLSWSGERKILSYAHAPGATVTFDKEYVDLNTIQPDAVKNTIRESLREPA